MSKKFPNYILFLSQTETSNINIWTVIGLNNYPLLQQIWLVYH